MLRVYNTLTRKKEDFQTLEPNVVRMYVCGVTVYNEAHVGHAMSALVFDIIRRYLEYRGYEVRHVMNYTDVDDKIINRANQLEEDPLKLAQRYIDDYARNLSDLNILPATSNPRATQTMARDPSHGQGADRQGLRLRRREWRCLLPRHARTRITANSRAASWTTCRPARASRSTKPKNIPMDFALWKAAKPGEPAWESPWGKGRPAGTSNARP